MATYYAVGTGNWSGSSTTWSTSSGGAPGFYTPTASDNVIIDAASGTGTVTCAGNAGAPDNCLNMTISSPSAYRILMGATAVLNVAGSWTAAAGITYAPNASSIINFTATSTGQTITSAGYRMGSMNFNGVGGGWTLQDALNPVALATITLTNGALDTNSQTVGNTSGVYFSSNNSNTRSLTLGTTTWTLSVGGSTATTWNLATSTGMTLSAASSTIRETVSNGTHTFQGGGFTYGTLIITGGTSTGSFTLNGTNTFSTVTFTGSSAPYYEGSGIFINATQTVTGTFTASGNNATQNRLFVASGNTGTSQTISAGTVTVTNTDFRDITGAGAGSWNFSALTTTANGDGGGNSGITFTTPKNCYMVTGSSVNWSAANWYTTSGGVTKIATAQPLLQDTAIFDANSITASGRTITVDTGRIAGSTWTGVTNSPAFATSSNAIAVYGSLILVSGMTHTGTGAVWLSGRGSLSFDGGTLTWPASSTFAVNSGSGTYSLARNFSSSAGLQTRSGTLDLNGYNTTFTTLAPQGGAVSGTGTITGTTYTQTGGTVTLGGLLTLTGAVAISAGTLDMNGYNETGATTLAVSSTGTLNLSGQFTCSSTITVSGGTVANTGASGELKTTGNSLITFSGGTSTCMKITEVGTSNIVVSGTGSLTLPAGGMMSWTSGTFQVVGSTALFSTDGPVTGTNSTLSVASGSSNGGGNFTFG